MSILSAVPSQIRAGDTLRLLLTLADHDAPTWTSVLYFENAKGTSNATGSASGASHSFTVSAAVTGALAAGNYKWSIRASSGGVAETVDEGWIEVLTDPAAAGTADPRTWAMRTLEAVEATLEGRATTDQLSMTINQRALVRIPLNELREWRTQLKQEVRSQTNAGGGNRDIKVRLSRG